MPNSLLTGVTGLESSQEMLNVVGNDLANINTTGFKSQSLLFSDLLYQTQSPATAPSSTSGGTDPIQVGNGTQTSSMETDYSQGALTVTGGQTDLAIQGNGFFVVNNGSGDLYTRDGSFLINADNVLVDRTTGAAVQRYGTLGEATATTPGFQVPGNDDIQIPMGTAIPGQQTTTITLQGNLDASAAGPAAAVLTTSTPLATKDATALTTATTLNDLTINNVAYGSGANQDTLVLQGTTAAGTTVDTTVDVGATTTVGDLINDINTSFPGSTAALSANGNLTITANSTGASPLSLTISDGPNNTGVSNWANEALQTTTMGTAGATVDASIQFYDSQGTAHNLSLVFQKTGNNTWSLTGSLPNNDGTVINGNVQGITFNANGSFQSVAGNSAMTIAIPGIAEPMTLNFNFGTPNGDNGLTQFGGTSSASATGQNGFAAGFLSSLSIGQNGIISGVFTNGNTLPIAQMAIASFSNPQGLTLQGDNYFSLSANSGIPQIGAGATGGNGSVEQGSLEASNVDVATAFTQLITAQEAFDVNSRTITVSDDVLQTLANIIPQQ